MAKQHMENLGGNFNMAAILKVTSPAGTEISISEKYIENVTLKAVTPDDSAARSSKQSILLTVTGKYANDVSGSSGEPIKDLYKWSLVQGEKNDAYRSVEAEYSNESIVLRNYKLPKAYVVDFDADFDSAMGSWTLTVAQKEDQLKDVQITGAYSAGE